MSNIDDPVHRPTTSRVPKTPGGGLGRFTDRDQRSILGFEFQNLYFLGTAQSCCIFSLLDKCCIFKCFIFLTVFFGSSYIFQVLQ